MVDVEIDQAQRQGAAAKGAHFAKYAATPVWHVIADLGFAARHVDSARDIPRPQAPGKR